MTDKQTAPEEADRLPLYAEETEERRMAQKLYEEQERQRRARGEV